MVTGVLKEAGGKVSALGTRIASGHIRRWACQPAQIV